MLCSKNKRDDIFFLMTNSDRMKLWRKWLWKEKIMGIQHMSKY